MNQNDKKVPKVPESDICLEMWMWIIFSPSHLVSQLAPQVLAVEASSPFLLLRQISIWKHFIFLLFLEKTKQAFVFCVCWKVLRPKGLGGHCYYTCQQPLPTQHSKPPNNLITLHSVDPLRKAQHGKFRNRWQCTEELRCVFIFNDKWSKTMKPRYCWQ